MATPPKKYNSFAESVPWVPTIDNTTAPKQKEKPNPNDRSNKYFQRLVPSGDSKAQEDLKPAGPYHVNHFVAYFTIAGQPSTLSSGRLTASNLTYLFCKNFTEIFSHRNIALAQFGIDDYKDFVGNKTVQFTIGGNIGTSSHKIIGFFHPDWVAMTCNPSRSAVELQSDDLFEATSFHGDTLKRRFLTDIEKNISVPLLELKDIGVAKPILTIIEYILKLNTGTLKEVFKRHFLAGTRSWRVGYDVTVNQFFVETIAIERFSCEHYRYADKLHSTRKDVLDLWDNLLNNFLHHAGFNGYRFKPVAAPKGFGGYEASTVNPYIRHQAFQFEDHLALLKECSNGSPVMTAILLNHPGLKYHLY